MTHDRGADAGADAYVDPYVDAIVQLLIYSCDTRDDFLSYVKGFHQGSLPTEWVEVVRIVGVHKDRTVIRTMWKDTIPKSVSWTGLVHLIRNCEDLDHRRAGEFEMFEKYMSIVRREMTTEDVAAFTHLMCVIVQYKLRQQQKPATEKSVKTVLLGEVGAVALSESKDAQELSNRVQDWVDEGLPASMEIYLKLTTGSESGM